MLTMFRIQACVSRRLPRAVYHATQKPCQPLITNARTQKNIINHKVCYQTIRTLSTSQYVLRWNRNIDQKKKRSSIDYQFEDKWNVRKVLHKQERDDSPDEKEKPNEFKFTDVWKADKPRQLLQKPTEHLTSDEVPDEQTHCFDYEVSDLSSESWESIESKWRTKTSTADKIAAKHRSKSKRRKSPKDALETGTVDNELESFFVSGGAVNPDRRIEATRRLQENLIKQPVTQPENPRRLKVAIIGAPNAGKSSLVNKLLNWKFSPVSSKVHTTRHRTLGVLTEENKQIIFLDTPGMITPERRKKHFLEPSLLTDPHSCLFEADLIMVVIDASLVWERHQLSPDILKVLHFHRNKKAVLVMNKVDLYGNKKELLHCTKILTKGVVASRSDYYRPTHAPKKLKKDKLESLFDQVDEQLNKEKMSSKSDTHFTNSHDQSTTVTDTDSVFSDDVVSKSREFTTVSSSDQVDEDDHENDNSLKTSRLLNVFTSEGKSFYVFTSKGKSFYEDSEKDGQVKDYVFENYDGCKGYGYQLQYHTATGKIFADEKTRKQWHGYYYSDLKQLEKQLEGVKGYDGFDRVFSTSALTGVAVDDIKRYLLESTMPDEWEFNETVVTDSDPFELAVMCVREGLFENFTKHLPYIVDVRVAHWSPAEDGVGWKVQFDLRCPSYHEMSSMLKRGGEILAAVAVKTRQELMNTFRQEFQVRLRVCVAPVGKKNIWLSESGRERMMNNKWLSKRAVRRLKRKYPVN